MGDWDQAVYHYRQAIQYIIKLSIIYFAVGWGPFIMIKSLIAFRDGIINEWALDGHEL
jgi:HEPN domain-containing protein